MLPATRTCPGEGSRRSRRVACEGSDVARILITEAKGRRCAALLLEYLNSEARRVIRPRKWTNKYPKDPRFYPRSTVSHFAQRIERQRLASEECFPLLARVRVKDRTLIPSLNSQVRGWTLHRTSNKTAS